MFDRLFKTQTEISPLETESGLKAYVADGVCSITMIGLQGGMFLTAFALFLGATPVQIGLLAGFGFLSQIMQIPGLMAVGMVPSRRGIVLLSAGLSRLIWIPVLVLAFLGGLNMDALLWLLFFSALIGALAGPAWNSLIRELVPEDRLGAVNGRRNLMGLAGSMIATLVAGFSLDWVQKNAPSWAGMAYPTMFALGLIFGLAGLYAITRIPETQTLNIDKPKLRQLLTEPLRNGNFRTLIAFLSLITFVLSMVGPFFTVYMLKRLEMSMVMLTILGLVAQLSNLFFFRVFGKLVDRLSNRAVLSVCVPLFLMTILLWCFTTLPERHRFSMPLLIVIQVLSGCALAGITLGTQNLTLKLSPRGMAHGYMAVAGLCASAAGAVGPLLGGVIVNALTGVELSVPLILKTPAGQHALPMINLQSLDFLFILAVIVGMASLHFLVRVQETGTVCERQVIDGMVESVVTPLRSFSTLAGLKRMAYVPVSGLIGKNRTGISSDGGKSHRTSG